MDIVIVDDIELPGLEVPVGKAQGLELLGKLARARKAVQTELVEELWTIAGWALRDVLEGMESVVKVPFPASSESSLLFWKSKEDGRVSQPVHQRREGRDGEDAMLERAERREIGEQKA